MHDDKESPYTLTLLNSELSLHVLQFTGAESLNLPYRFEIEVIGLASTLDPERLLQQPAFLSLSADAGIHGIIHSAAREHRGQHCIGYTLVLVPHLQNLDGAPCRRVFHQLDVPSLLRELLVENAVPASSYRFELPTARYPVRAFCIQYDESDLAFMQRLCEEEGIHFHFVHQRDDHVLVFADDSLSFPQEPLLMPFQPEAAQPEHMPIISEMFQRHSAPPSLANPAPDQLHREQLSRRILQRLRCRQRQIQGQSNQRELNSAASSRSRTIP